MSSLPPPHPSLPHPLPQLPQPPQPIASSSHQAYPSYYNSHYLQAYTGPSPVDSAYSNAYAPQPQVTLVATGTNFVSRPIWYEPGNHRCSHPGCTFTGSPKTVETHMMDRHLIYPPGWDKQKKKPDWDADPSLKGKPIPIQGTNVVLDTPEVLEAWIAERKRRFPTSSRVQDNKRKLEEAVARGQLDMTQNIRPNKRRNVETYDTFNREERKTDKFFNNRQRNRSGQGDEQHERVPDSGWPRRVQSTTTAPAPETKKVVAVSSALSDLESGSEDEGEPEIISSKVAPPFAQPPSVNRDAQPDVTEKNNGVGLPNNRTKNPAHKKIPLQPKLPPRNPFGSRPTLLRNLLLPEIRVTISNLSQAIRFLVDNDFLVDVELKPGQAAESNRIQVVGLEEHAQKDINKAIG